jgi:hypothetical protein
VKKLPILSRPVPAAAQRELSAKPVGGGSKPAFPTRDQAYRAAGLGSLLVAGLAGSAVAAPPPMAQSQVAMSEAGSVDGQAIAATRPKFKVWREGGGIGPAEDMWVPKDVEAFINWTFAREGTLAMVTNYRIDAGGTAIKLDGFDPARNVGYVYSDQQSMALGASERGKLDAMVKDGKLAILYLDLKRAPDAATLHGKVVKFLATSQKAPPSSTRLPVAAPAAPKKKK